MARTWTVEQLGELLKAANEAAIEWDQNHFDGNDGGSCNLDAPTFYFLKGTRVTSKTIEKAAKLAGVSVWKDRYRWIMIGDLYGQGFRRTNMAKAASAKLAELAKDIIPELQASVYYAMD